MRPSSFMAKNVHDNLIYILLQEANDRSLNVFMKEKNDHQQRLAINSRMPLSKHFLSGR